MPNARRAFIAVVVLLVAAAGSVTYMHHMAVERIRQQASMSAEAVEEVYLRGGGSESSLEGAYRDALTEIRNLERLGGGASSMSFASWLKDSLAAPVSCHQLEVESNADQYPAIYKSCSAQLNEFRAESAKRIAAL